MQFRESLEDDFRRKCGGTINALVMKAAMPWFEECFNKYTETGFHVKMKNGFSFMQDFRDNHSGGFDETGKKRDKKYLKFIKFARVMYDVTRIGLDVEQVLDSIIGLLYGKGWVLYVEEVSQMRSDLVNLEIEIEN